MEKSIEIIKVLLKLNEYWKDCSNDTKEPTENWINQTLLISQLYSEYSPPFSSSSSTNTPLKLLLSVLKLSNSLVIRFYHSSPTLHCKRHFTLNCYFCSRYAHPSQPSHSNTDTPNTTSTGEVVRLQLPHASLVVALKYLVQCFAIVSLHLGNRGDPCQLDNQALDTILNLQYYAHIEGKLSTPSLQSNSPDYSFSSFLDSALEEVTTSQMYTYYITKSLDMKAGFKKLGVLTVDKLGGIKKLLDGLRALEDDLCEMVGMFVDFAMSFEQQLEKTTTEYVITELVKYSFPSRRVLSRSFSTDHGIFGSWELAVRSIENACSLSFERTSLNFAKKSVQFVDESASLQFSQYAQIPPVDTVEYDLHNTQQMDNLSEEFHDAQEVLENEKEETTIGGNMNENTPIAVYNIDTQGNVNEASPVTKRTSNTQSKVKKTQPNFPSVELSPRNDLLTQPPPSLVSRRDSSSSCSEDTSNQKQYQNQVDYDTEPPTISPRPSENRRVSNSNSSSERTSPYTRRRAVRRPFTATEVAALEEGVGRYGKQWAVILSTYRHVFDPVRTGVDLKDKARNEKKRLQRMNMALGAWERV